MFITIMLSTGLKPMQILGILVIGAEFDLWYRVVKIIFAITSHRCMSILQRMLVLYTLLGIQGVGLGVARRHGQGS